MPIELEESGRGFTSKNYNSYFSFINKLELLDRLTKNCEQREKVQVSRSFEDLGRRTGIPKGLKQKWKIPEERGG